MTIVEVVVMMVVVVAVAMAMVMMTAVCGGGDRCGDLGGVVAPLKHRSCVGRPFQHRHNCKSTWLDKLWRGNPR